jgi:hypothetical protein
VFPLVQLLWTEHPPILWQLNQLWLIYYYLSLAFRENILQVNGSSIKNWWIYHHYVSVAICTILLVWPDADITALKKRQFLLFAAVQGGVMFFQNIYQKRRNYVRRSLGQASQVDVESSETIVEKPTDLKLLVPLLLALYVFELYLGGTMLLYYYQQLAGVRKHQLLFMGALMLVLGIGNLLTTMRVLFEKCERRRFKQKLQAMLSSSKKKKNKQT